jgi:singapore isolate B (sub-type 7) whole genome shotgun sequence assembly, scaffold_1
MEKENSKSREDSRKQYNATVLRLVTLCKKTDPRYTEAIEAEKKERERKEEEARKRQQEAENRRKEELRSKMETGVTKVKKLITM